MSEYTVRWSRRSRHIRIRVAPGGGVFVTAPTLMSVALVEKFVEKQARWIERAAERMSGYKSLPVSGRRDYLKHREEARGFLTERVAYWNKQYGFTYGRIAIKDTKRLWGSCSRKGNINFSYALLFLPRELADYVVVHELCHLAELNHSKQFWALVAQRLPEYVSLRRELRRYAPRMS